MSSIWYWHQHNLGGKKAHNATQWPCSFSWCLAEGQGIGDQHRDICLQNQHHQQPVQLASNNLKQVVMGMSESANSTFANQLSIKHFRHQHVRSFVHITICQHNSLLLFVIIAFEFVRQLVR